MPLHRSLLLLVLTVGCRDAADPFVARDRTAIGTEPVRLTYSGGDDRSPAWSPGSDSVYYSASASELDPESQGVLLSIARDGGRARVLVASQPGRAITDMLLEPAPAPDRRALAFIRMGETAPAAPCTYQVRSCGAAEPLATPALIEAWLGVAESPDADDWTRLVVLHFDGAASPAETTDGVATWLSRFHPHQQRWSARRLLPFKPTWSPDGTRIAVVDGSGLSVVDVTTGERRLVAAGDVANPAWSPDGTRIALDRVEREDSATDTCVYLVPDPKTGELVPNCREHRVHYAVTPQRTLLLDVSGAIEGQFDRVSDPAWHPDGRWLYVVTADGIARLDPETGESTPLAGTEDGEEPAVSPDGRWLAFTRYDGAAGSRDVWVAALPPPEGD